MQPNPWTPKPHKPIDRLKNDKQSILWDASIHEAHTRMLHASTTAPEVWLCRAKPALKSLAARYEKVYVLLLCFYCIGTVSFRRVMSADISCIHGRRPRAHFGAGGGDTISHNSRRNVWYRVQAKHTYSQTYITRPALSFKRAHARYRDTFFNQNLVHTSKCLWSTALTSNSRVIHRPLLDQFLSLLILFRII